MEYDPSGVAELSIESDKAAGGVIIVNADDWGRDTRTTDRILECARHEAISSASAMVFMEDSERAAELAREHGVDAGLHLNLTMGFDGDHCTERVKEEQGKLARALSGHRYASTVYRPGLARAFDYVVKAQLEEYERLYGAPARRIDGHRHMHLCANVIFQGLLPVGTIVRRNFTFEASEKGWINRVYRYLQDRHLAKRHPMADYFFDLQPLEPRRLERFGELARLHDVEIETHVIRDEEYEFLMEGQLSSLAAGAAVARGYVLRKSSGKGNAP
jgi:nucleotide-binding universal stress UspA family protein